MIKTSKRLLCRHYEAHWVGWRILNRSPLTVQAVYQCEVCGRLILLKLYGKEAQEWISEMEDKHDHTNQR